VNRAHALTRSRAHYDCCPDALISRLVLTHFIPHLASNHPPASAARDGDFLTGKDRLDTGKNRFVTCQNQFDTCKNDFGHKKAQRKSVLKIFVFFVISCGQQNQQPTQNPTHQLL
jgi:hypothetical protein